MEEEQGEEELSRVENSNRRQNQLVVDRSGHCTPISPWSLKDWAIDRKVPKELGNIPFDGDVAHYKEWHANVRDSLLGCNQR